MKAMRDSTRERAAELDAADPLAGFRARFVISDPDLIYLDGNSLGRLGHEVPGRIQVVVNRDWGDRLIRSWNEGWWEAPSRIGEMLAPLLGAGPGQVIISDQTSLNLFKLSASALRLRRSRKKIITDALNFPSDLYILQGVANLLGDGHQIIRIDSTDGGITPDLAALEYAIDENTALVALSHVAFKSGYLYDMQAITERVHHRGALVLWDLSHSAGVVPIALDAWNVDMAIGCTYKYLNGGPGAPAFLYVAGRLQDEAQSPIWGWWGEARPFDFELDFQPVQGVRRFLSGTAPMLSMLALEPALGLVAEAGVEAIREKSVKLTEYAIALSDTLLAPVGFGLGSPRDAARRGSHISLRHPEGYRINRALIEEMNVLPDFRDPDNIRLGLAPLYTSFTDVWEGIERMRRVVVEGRFQKYAQQRTAVT
jgi:kynureninase